jgi:hypothetical protein
MTVGAWRCLGLAASFDPINQHLTFGFGFQLAALFDQHFGGLLLEEYDRILGAQDLASSGVALHATGRTLG